jgi:hypothetical protein
MPKGGNAPSELGNAEQRERLEEAFAGLQLNEAPPATEKLADPGAHALGVYLSALGFSLPIGCLLTG